MPLNAVDADPEGLGRSARQSNRNFPKINRNYESVECARQASSVERDDEGDECGNDEGEFSGFFLFDQVLAGLGMGAVCVYGREGDVGSGNVQSRQAGVIATHCVL